MDVLIFPRAVTKGNFKAQGRRQFSSNQAVTSERRVVIMNSYCKMTVSPQRPNMTWFKNLKTLTRTAGPSRDNINIL